MRQEVLDAIKVCAKQGFGLDHVADQVIHDAIERGEFIFSKDNSLLNDEHYGGLYLDCWESWVVNEFKKAGIIIRGFVNNPHLILVKEASKWSVYDWFEDCWHRDANFTESEGGETWAVYGVGDVISSIKNDIKTEVYLLRRELIRRGGICYFRRVLWGPPSC